jgi:hypothetical protein
MGQLVPSEQFGNIYYPAFISLAPFAKIDNFYHNLQDIIIPRGYARRKSGEKGG